MVIKFQLNVQNKQKQKQCTNTAGSDSINPAKPVNQTTHPPRRPNGQFIHIRTRTRTCIHNLHSQFTICIICTSIVHINSVSPQSLLHLRPVNYVLSAINSSPGINSSDKLGEDCFISLFSPGSMYIEMRFKLECTERKCGSCVEEDSEVYTTNTFGNHRNNLWNLL